MTHSWASLGGRLRSVALRYRRPIGRPDGMLVAPDRPQSLCFLRKRGFSKAAADLFESGGESARGATARDEVLARLEAILFLARSPQTSRRLAQLADLADGTEARTLVRKLNRLYDSEGCAFRVEEVAGGLLLMSRARFAPWLRRLQQAPAEIRLSGPAMETLAVVAYRQPVLRADIEAIRGVQCGEILRQLIERDLVRIAGRSDDLGRPLMYGTTKQFLEVFGLRHLEELPRRESLRMPISTEVEATETGSEAQNRMCQPNHSLQAEEEMNVKAVVAPTMHANDLESEDVALASPHSEEPSSAQLSDDDLDDAEFDDDYDEDDDDDEEGDDYDEEDYDEDEEDDYDEEEGGEGEGDDFEGEEWEEVGDEDDDSDEDEDDEDQDDEEWEDEDDLDEEEEDYDEDDEDWDEEDWDEEDDED